MSSHVGDAVIGALLGEAQRWRLLVLLFERPRGPWWSEVEALARACDECELRSLAVAARDADEGVFLALLGPGGVVSARETGHRPVADPGHLLAALQAFYSAFAYAPDSEEPPDHVSVEAGFLGYLKLKQAYALAAGRDTEAQTCEAAAAAFLGDHLAAVAEPLSQALAAASDGYLALAGQALYGRVGPRRLQEAGWVPSGLDDFGCAGAQPTPR